MKNYDVIKPTIVNSKGIIAIACCPSSFKSYIIIQLLANSLMAIPKSFIVDVNIIFTIKPPSTIILLTFSPQVYPVTNEEWLCGLDPNNKLLMNIVLVLQVAN